MRTRDAHPIHIIDMIVTENIFIGLYVAMEPYSIPIAHILAIIDKMNCIVFIIVCFFTFP